MKKNILATLTYADIFDYPLTEDEIFQWQIRSNDQWPMTNDQCERELKDLVKNKKIETKSGLYYLPERFKILEIRKRREGWSKIKFEKAKHVSSLLQFIPWIKFIGISGGLALNNTDQDDDIDFFIITSKKRIWLTRALVVSFLTVFGWYRRPKNIADKICPNFFIDEAHLEIKPHDLYTAHEVAQLKPLIEKGDTYFKFLSANSWVKDFLPNALNTGKINLISKKMGKLSFYHPFYSLDLLENLFMNFQLKFMSKKRTTEVTSHFLIKFHPSDMHNIVLEKYRQKMASDI